jgi:hypothetical protein
MGFHRVPEVKTVKNRMHFDLITTDFDAEIDRLTGLGATKLNEIKGGRHWATLAGPRSQVPRCAMPDAYTFARR